MRNIKLTTEYDGSLYHGWQKQSRESLDCLPTVQGEIEEAILKLTGVHSDVFGCSRTDAGVHAFGHVSNFHTEATIPPDKFYFALNTVLPKTIRVKNSCEVPDDFHARFSCKGKKYLYKIYNSPTMSALLQNRAWFEPTPLNVEKMAEAASLFKGTHDFTAFQAVGCTAKSTVKTIFDAKVWVESEDRLQEISFEVSGDSFLYNMVRIMAGTLVEVGKGKIQPHEIPDIILSKDRRKGGATAPPHGLYLKEVWFE